MHSQSIRWKPLLLSASTALILSACGGGGGDGGGGGSASGGSSLPTIGGTASKGLMAHANVTAYCGVAPNNPVGTTTTDGNGQYSIQLTAACNSPVEIVVSAVSGTTMLDEISGTSIAIPPNSVSMRAFVSSANGTVSQPVTPFTEMAASVAISAAGASAPTSAIVSNANSAIISTVLGGDSAIFSAQPVAPSAYSASTPAQQKLVTLLTAIAASSSSGGANTAVSIQTVLTALNNQAVQTIPTVTSTSYSVSSNAAGINVTAGNTATPLGLINAGLTSIASGAVVASGATAAIATNASYVSTVIINNAAINTSTSKGTSVATNGTQPQGQTCSTVGGTGIANTCVTLPGIVSTFAGSGTSAELDGTGTAASFRLPLGVALDSVGNVYVADATELRKITPGGVVSTLAGSGTSGYVDGTGATAKFSALMSVAVDAGGNIYVGDGAAIRKVTPAGVVTNLAGMNSAAYMSTAVNGTGTAARFSQLTGVAVDSVGNVYVSDEFNHVIRKITPAGLVTTFAGSGSISITDGTGTAASFYDPNNLAVDANDNVYVADFYAIRKITPAGVVSTLAGSAPALLGATGSVDGPGSSASFIGARGLTIDAAGNLYVLQTNPSFIRKVTAAGVVTTLAGIGTAGFVNGKAGAASFNYGYSLAVDATGKIYVADTLNYVIRMFTP